MGLLVWVLAFIRFEIFKNFIVKIYAFCNFWFTSIYLLPIVNEIISLYYHSVWAFNLKRKKKAEFKVFCHLIVFKTSPSSRNPYK